MNIFALLGLASLVYAENDDKVVKRRRLAIQKCSFGDLRAEPHNPNCLATFTWAMDEATGDAKTLAINRHPYKCCLNKHPGWTTASKLQNACVDAAKTDCQAIKGQDAVCQAVDKTKKSFFTEGYKYTECDNKYSDDCRSSLTCDTAGGFTGYPDLACQTGFNGDFFVRGCGRGDAGELGVDLTMKVMIVAPHTAPKQNGNPKNSFHECRSSALHYDVQSFFAGNGACDQDNTCNTVDTCGVLPTFDGILEASESEDTWVKPFLFKSKQNENCVSVENNKQPTGLEGKPFACPNGAGDTDTATYGGFALYGERLNCWRNMGGGIGAFKKNTDFNAADLTKKVMFASVNAGIGTTLEQWEKDNGGDTVYQYPGLQNGDIGYGVCDKTVGLGGCTAELSAIMCEAYNKQLVKGGAQNTNGFCVGFLLTESKIAMGDLGKKSAFGYKKTHDHDMLVGFLSKAGYDGGREKGRNTNGGYFKYIPIADCLVTSTVSCSRCETCATGKSRTSDGKCVATCPQFQYSSGGVCTYRTPHCIKGNAAGTTCSECHAGYGLSADKTVCEESGCLVPAAAAMKSKANVLLVGAVQLNSPACVGPQNLVPGATCGITCAPGFVSTDPSKTHVYSCPSKGSVTVPEIICAACGVAKCSSCPSAQKNVLCDVCEDQYVLSADKKKCEAKACPNTGAAGDCKICPLGSTGTLGWDVVAKDFDYSACKACTVENCKDCAGDEAVCKTCDTGYAKEAANGKKCIKLAYCKYGTKGTTTWDVSNEKFIFTNCKLDTAKCADTSQTAGSCTDCQDGYAGSVDWDYVNQAFNDDQCTAVACPLSTETSPACNNCPAFTAGKPLWDDLFNQWAGCVANDFGFSGPSASWAGSVSADANVAAMQMASAKMLGAYVIEAVSAEQLHVANGQYDAIKGEWVCDEGYAGVGCKQRLCPETVAFTSGTDGFTPSKSSGFSFTTDAGTSTSATFSNQHSYRECGGRGTCDFETGICQCFPGFTGVGCRRTTCPNSCSGHGVCMNDDIANYHAASAGNGNLPEGDIDINTWGNLWSADKFQGCKCDGGWGGNDCSLRQCPRGDDPETLCADQQGYDIQYLTCTKMKATTEQFFNLRFTDLLGNRYNTRAIVIHPHTDTPSAANAATIGPAYMKAASHSIQTALESLPNFAIPQIEVTTNNPIPQYPETETCVTTPESCTGKGKKKKCTPAKTECTTKVDYVKEYKVTFGIKFTDARNTGKQALLEARSDVKCLSGVQPKFTNTVDPTCTATRAPIALPYADLRENTECSNRGLCNRKTAECNCFDGYTGLACDTVAQTY